MNPILHAAFFKGYWIPPEFGQTTFTNMVRNQRRTFDDARKQIIDAMIALGQANLTVLELVAHIDMDISAQMVNHHMKRLHEDGLVRKEKKKGKAIKGGQPPILWSLVK